ncbi:MAG: hypothetical protein ACR2OZ_19295 [Verrucomicrobiales bacterium]
MKTTHFILRASPLAALSFAFLTPFASAQVETIIEMGAEWRYLDTITNAPAGQAPPTIGGVSDWRAINYNAAAPGSGWKVGSGFFGFGDTLTPTYGTTLLFGGDPANKNITTYFWKKFQLPAGAVFGQTYNQLQLGIKRDDGLVVYINGQEIRRDNLPGRPAPITQATLATSAVDDANEGRIFETSHDASVLNPPGQDNIIAVELHQVSIGSSDLRFDLFLNIADSPPCFGVAKPGISVGFNYDGTEGDEDIVHRRINLEEPIPPDTFESQDTEMNWKINLSQIGGQVLIGDVDPITGKTLPSNAMGLFGDKFIWDSEAIDTRGFTGLRALLNFQTVAQTPNTWAATENFEVILRTSTDGIIYRDVPWFFISSTGGSQFIDYTDLVAENAVKKAIAPVSEASPPNTGAANWRKLAFDDAAWRTSVQGKGAGFDAFPGTPPSFLEHIDPNLDFKTEVYTTKVGIYMRCRFPAVPNLSTFTHLQLLAKYNDGFVAFLNDQEIFRKKVAGTGAVPFNTTANDINTKFVSVVLETFDVSTHIGKLLTNQENVLAIHFMNSGTTSSTMLMWPLLKIGQSAGPPPPKLSDLDDGDIATYRTFDSSAYSQGGLSLIPDGTQSLRIRINANIESFDRVYYLDDIKVLGIPTNVHTYDAYALGKMPAPTYTDANRAADADADGDSIPNLAEYAFGTDPTIPALVVGSGATAEPIEPEVWIDQAGFVLCRFRLPGGTIEEGSEPGIGYSIGDINVRPQIWFGGDEGWQDRVTGVNYFEQDGNVTEASDGAPVVTVKSIQPLRDLNDTLFVRVRVGQRHPSYLGGVLASQACDF